MRKTVEGFALAMPVFFCIVSACFFQVHVSAAIPSNLPENVCDTAEIRDVPPDSACMDSTDVMPWPQTMQASLDELVRDDMFQRSQLGLYVYDLTADSAIYGFGQRQLMRPASVQKLLTTVTALTNLGGSFQFVTRFYMNGTVSDSILSGDLYLKGGFDPRFGNDDMNAFIEELVERGVKQIDGRIFSDMSLKDTLKWGEGWCWDDDERTLRPLLYNGKDVFMAKFYEKLDENGIAHPMAYTEKQVPQDSVALLAERSHTVDQILMQLLKNSDNLYAEALFYQLGAMEKAHYPSARVSADKVNGLIRSLGLDPDDYNVADGSGLSLYNYTTPELVVQLLRYAWKCNNIYLHLFPALPIAGVDGTLERRMCSGNAYSNVHAKTGTLRGVSTLAGYATASNEHVICFCIMNQGIRSNSTAHRFQDKVCQIITR